MSIHDLIERVARGESPRAVLHEDRIEELTGVDISLVGKAMDVVRKEPYKWFLDPPVSQILDAGHKMGWVYRPSTSQVEWTDKGVAALKAAQAKLEQAMTIFRNLQHSIRDLEEALHHADRPGVAFAFGLLLPKLETLADDVMGKGVVTGLIPMAEACRSWGFAHNAKW